MNPAHIGLITVYCPTCEQDAAAYSVMVAQWWVTQHNTLHEKEWEAAHGPR